MSEAINKYWEGEEISWGEPLSEPKSLLSSEVPREENNGQKTSKDEHKPVCHTKEWTCFTYRWKNASGESHRELGQQREAGQGKNKSQEHGSILGYRASQAISASGPDPQWVPVAKIVIYSHVGLGSCATFKSSPEVAPGRMVKRQTFFSIIQRQRRWHLILSD